MTHSSTATPAERKRDTVDSQPLTPSIVKKLRTKESPTTDELADKIEETMSRRDGLLADFEESQNEKEKSQLREKIVGICLELKKLEGEIARQSFSKWRLPQVHALFEIEKNVPVSDLLSDFTVDFANMPQEFQGAVRRVHENWSLMEEHQTGITGAPEAQRNHFIHFMLIAALSSLPLRRTLQLHCESRLSGTFAQGPVEFLLKERQAVVLVVEAKKEDFAQGEAQVLMQLYEARHTLKKETSGIKNIFGIVSTAVDWIPYVFNIKDQSFFKGTRVLTEIEQLPRWERKKQQTLPGIDTIINMIHEMIKMSKDDSLNFA